ncbi:MAG: class I SAM-dependent methyltransferase [bacterium]
MKEIDLSLLDLIKNAKTDDLKNEKYLEENLLPKLGLNNERPKMFPKELIGFGLFHCQYPIQFGKYLALLSKLKIDSYMEIGVRHGGTFVITNEYLKRFGNLQLSLAVDIGYSPSLVKYCEANTNAKFVQINSQSKKFRQYLQNYDSIDLVLVDADHTELGCRYDYESVKELANIVVLHDISNDNCLGVKNVWESIKQESNKYICYEFIGQYQHILKKENKEYLGIGVAVKRDYIKKMNILIRD